MVNLRPKYKRQFSSGWFKRFFPLKKDPAESEYVGEISQAQCIIYSIEHWMYVCVCVPHITHIWMVRHHKCNDVRLYSCIVATACVCVFMLILTLNMTIFMEKRTLTCVPMNEWEIVEVSVSERVKLCTRTWRIRFMRDAKCYLFYRLFEAHTVQPFYQFFVYHFFLRSFIHSYRDEFVLFLLLICTEILSVFLQISYQFFIQIFCCFIFWFQD